MKKPARIMQHIIVYILCFIFIVPFLWLLLASVKDYYQIFRFPPSLIPKPFVWQNYSAIFNELLNINFFQLVYNTLILCTFGVLAAVVTNTIVAYGFSRFKFRGREVIFLIVLGTMMIPAQLLYIPRYILFKNFGWVGTYLPLLVPSFIGGNAVYIFFLRQFLGGISKVFDDSAEIDGCGTFKTLTHILVPMLKPGLVFIIISEFIGRWNDFMEPMIFLTKEKTFPISLAVLMMQSKINNIFMLHNAGQDPTGMYLALCVLTLIPPFLLYIFFQRYFIDGIRMGAIKG